MAELRRGTALRTGLVVLAACSPGPDAPVHVVLPAPVTAGTEEGRASGMSIRPDVVKGEDHDVHAFGFEVASARFEVIDTGMSPALLPVLERTGGSLVVNGGFFDRERKPEGLVISGGDELAPLSAALGGGVLVIAQGRASLHDAVGFTLPPGTEFAVQARPRLVVDGARNIRGDDGPRAERTALCIAGGGQRMTVFVVRGEGAGRGPTLGQLAGLLVARGCEQALNLDGGPSTGAAWRLDGRTHELAPRGPIRHAIAVRIDR